MVDKNCLSYWFPKLQAAGIRVPKTEIVRAAHDLTPLLDGKLPKGWGAFLAELNMAIERVGGQPAFLRTGQGSGKHQWKETCHLDLAKGTLPNHVARLVEWSEMVDIMGLPTDVWVVRELLPTKPVCILPAYGDFPLVPEVRCFVGGGKILCLHSYWPRKSIEEGFPYLKCDLWDKKPVRDVPTYIDEIVAMAQQPALEPSPEMIHLAESVAAAFADDGNWSVDLLPTDRGWFVTDCAEAARSYHWEGCEAVDGKVA